jgi:cytochrome c-type biogenesis protein CcmF
MNLYPAASEPIGSPSIQRGFVWDLYASLISLQHDGRSATFRFYHNPGVNWLWIGGAIMALGGAAAAWPGRRRRTNDKPAESAVARREALMAGIR